ncbi:23S rRNA (uracil(1939)-C(5))-methyltransferase RlmD [Agriterribacter sp.]|uniref:23S rRNA (uracil(1939)-C(5))-methyltransferase RlmD n=1 Tax=Agriterribacter sp. TaxID=2821509 RepID=UPI002BCAD5D5|nr:23S rRNA (uracil(1939)-C(5))-methyltransferase RlmD [Agriterribacter sp.]HRO44547.1 23S rRNA (uracil(1939)-C(5))-methyltransferase RlmD [Agriterribacter sp.]HRQ15984.1 23S rRNA (uracil(1939)-C(5))-methyltransferase RlmD [Agriterribacter sp.]
MSRKKVKNQVLEQVLVEDYAAEGKSLSRVNGKVIFIEGAVPGDVVDVLLGKNKKDWAEGKAIRIHTLSASRTQPFCSHFGVCGGCKWQMLPYEKQLEYKQNEVEQNLRRLGHISLPPLMPILGCDRTVRYRNKLEFTFSNHRYKTWDEIQKDPLPLQPRSERKEDPALGFHVPRIFDKVIDITTCHLMEEPANLIKNTVRDFSMQQGYPFYDIRQHTGWLRNLIIRVCTTGEVMVNICLAYDEKAERKKLLNHLLEQAPSITTLLYTINSKKNDSIYDLAPQIYYGKGYITERLEDLQFKISPKSFFQTNSRQGEKLYQVTRNFAELTGNQTVYDLYCGTGSIGIFVSRLAKKVIGVELIPEAITDAKENALLNGIDHAVFFAGDVIDVCNDTFIAQQGKPDVIITDPPRAGMHEKLVRKILEMEAPLVVYVSCNSATQARDLQLLNEKYEVTKVQPVDMFPHTHHIENVVQLKLK